MTAQVYDTLHLMFWTAIDDYLNVPSETESQLHFAVSAPLFSPNQIYLEVEKLIGDMGQMKNIPDGPTLK